MNTSYYQIVGNSAGVFADTRNQDLAWNGEWTYKASSGDGAWEGELSIPFSSLGLEVPTEGTSIGFNVCRDQQTPGQQLSCWSAVHGSFHDVESFGRLTFSSASPVTRQAVADIVSRNVAQVRLQIDWQALGMDRSKATLTAPALEHFQPARTFRADAPIPVDSGRGWLLMLKEE